MCQKIIFTRLEVFSTILHQRCAGVALPRCFGEASGWSQTRWSHDASGKHRGGIEAERQ